MQPSDFSQVGVCFFFFYKRGSKGYKEEGAF